MFEELISLVRREQVSLFIGAGFSKEAGAPSVWNLQKSILERIYDTEKRKSHENDSLADLSNFFVNEIHLGSRNPLMRILRKAFDFVPTCTDDHNLLAKIPHFRRIFTTNYDTLLEDSYAKNDVCVVRNDADCAYMNKPFTVVKVHGDFTDPDSVVITSDDYKQFFSANKNPIMWDLVKTEFATKNILFIGYSLEDNNILDIIQKVSDAQGSNQNEMFLIAPGISPEKQEKLKELKVHYFDAVANVFLTQLIEELKEHITEDFKNKYISGETCTRFLKSYQILPTVQTPVQGNNAIKNVESTTEKPLLHQIQMSVKAEIGEKLKNLDFEKDGELVSNQFFPQRPCFRIAGENLLKCQHLVNGVVLTSDIKEILVSPVEKKFDLTFQIPSRDFLEMVTAKVYILNDKTIRFDVDCDVYFMRIGLHVFQDGSPATVTFNFDFKKQYKNNDNAIKWIDVPCALFANEDFIIQELSRFPLNLTSPLQSLENNNYDCFKRYYKDIKRIELAIGKKFKVYNECTEQSWRIAAYICSYLYREPINVRCDDKDGLNFSTKTEEGGELIESFKVNDHISIVTTDERVFKYELNNRTFNIPFGYRILNSCQITNIQKEENGQIFIEFHYDKPTFLLLLSGKSMSEEFPDMKPLNAIIKAN
ncbi:SIR2 family NAD-dependent protein deacylase [Phocaeicola plebeius]|uniref:SIR2 family NAD-dependent protein deacylase n=1 Tax=Phocaeicola plebeius TaxID=310297 RepID=UPI003AB76FAB